jgi:hypothetical protein
MKQSITLFLFMFLLASSNAGIIAVPASQSQHKTTGTAFHQFMSTVNAKIFNALTPTKVQGLTGYKMNILERTFLKLAQKKVKKQVKKGIMKETDLVYTQLAKIENINWGTYVLCALLGPIGIIIVYLSNYDDREVARKSAWRGLLTWASIAAAVVYLLSI